MSYLDILRRVEQGKRTDPDLGKPESRSGASGFTKNEKSLPSRRILDDIVFGPDDMATAPVGMMFDPDGDDNDVTIEPASPTARPVFFERSDGRIYGPAKPEFLAREGTGPAAIFWVVVQFHSLPVWVRSDLLRSRAQYEQQTKPAQTQNPTRAHASDSRR